MEYEPSSPVVADEKSELSVLSIEESSLRDGIENIKISGAHDTNENGDLSAEEDRPTHVICYFPFSVPPSKCYIGLPQVLLLNLTWNAISIHFDSC